MPQANDLSRSLTALDENSTLIAVIEMSQARWLVSAIVPGVERRPSKKLETSEELLLALLHRWRAEAGKAGRWINRMAVAFEAGRDGFWLALSGTTVSPCHSGCSTRSRRCRPARSSRISGSARRWHSRASCKLHIRRTVGGAIHDAGGRQTIWRRQVCRQRGVHRAKFW